MLAPNNNRGMTYQTDECTLLLFQNTLLGWLNEHIIVIILVFYDVSLHIISLNIYKM
jgi:hypothetical protein